VADAQIRIDKWLWHARFFKSRTQAGKFCLSGGVRVNAQAISKAHVQVKPGDVLTFVKGNAVKVVKIIQLGTRRGPAPEAQALYEDQSPALPQKSEPSLHMPPAQRAPGSGRPTKAERRAIHKFMDGE